MTEPKNIKRNKTRPKRNKLHLVQSLPFRSKEEKENLSEEEIKLIKLGLY